MGFSIDSLLDLITNNPYNLFIILSITYVRNLIKKIDKIDDITENINKYKIEIAHLKTEIQELKNKYEKLDNEQRSYTRKGGENY